MAAITSCGRLALTCTSVSVCIFKEERLPERVRLMCFLYALNVAAQLYGAQFFFFSPIYFCFSLRFCEILHRPLCRRSRGMQIWWTTANLFFFQAGIVVIMLFAGFIYQRGINHLSAAPGASAATSKFRAAQNCYLPPIYKWNSHWPTRDPYGNKNTVLVGWRHVNGMQIKFVHNLLSVCAALRSTNDVCSEVKAKRKVNSRFVNYFVQEKFKKRTVI